MLEKDAQQLGNTFVKQSKQALETFQHKRKADDQVAAMVDTAGQIDSLVNQLSLSPPATTQWEKLRTELHQVAEAFNVQDPYQARPPA
jgi:hypothetical protein